MNTLNSIKKYKQHPMYLKLQIEIVRQWKFIQQDSYFSWWLIALMLWLFFSVFFNFVHQSNELKKYILEKEIVNNYHPRTTTLELGSSYIMGTPASKLSGSVQMEPLFIEAILYSDISKKREVLLRHSNGTIKTYHIGDTTDSGIKIVDILEQSVKLEMGGAEKILRVKQYQNDFLSDKPLNTSTEIFQDPKN